MNRHTFAGMCWLALAVVTMVGGLSIELTFICIAISQVWFASDA